MKRGTRAIKCCLVVELWRKISHVAPTWRKKERESGRAVKILSIFCILVVVILFFGDWMIFQEVYNTLLCFTDGPTCPPLSIRGGMGNVLYAVYVNEISIKLLGAQNGKQCLTHGRPGRNHAQCHLSQSKDGTTDPPSKQDFKPSKQNHAQCS